MAAIMLFNEHKLIFKQGDRRTKHLLPEHYLFNILGQNAKIFCFDYQRIKTECLNGVIIA